MRTCFFSQRFKSLIEYVLAMIARRSWNAFQLVKVNPCWPYKRFGPRDGTVRFISNVIVKNKPVEPGDGECCGNDCRDCVWVEYWSKLEAWQDEATTVKLQVDALSPASSVSTKTPQAQEATAEPNVAEPKPA